MMQWERCYRRAARQALEGDLYLTLRAAFDESKYVRDEEGQFAEKGSGGAGKTAKSGIGKNHPIEDLYSKAGKPGLTNDEIDNVFSSELVQKSSMKDLRELAKKINVFDGNGKFPKNELLRRMAGQIKNRAGTHSRVRN